MVNTLLTAFTLGSKSKSSYSRIHPGIDERNNNNKPSRHRNNRTENIWWRTPELVWNKYNSYFSKFWRSNRLRYSLYYKRCRRRLSTRSSESTSEFNNWFSSIRNNRYRTGNRNRCSYYLLISLLAVGCTPAYADEDVYNTAAPKSTATGNVTNQAVQFQNNGAPSRQNMGPSIACNGPTMTFSPFWLASESKPYDPESYSRGWNYGGQLNFMVPLDGSIT